MAQFFTLPYLFLLSSTLFCLGVGIFSITKRSSPGAWLLGLLMLQMTGYTLPYTLQVASQSLEPALLWHRVSLLGLCAIGPTWFAFSMHYTGRAGWLNRQRTAMLLAVPILTVLLGITNDLHGWFGTDYYQIVFGPYRLLYFTYRFYWVDLLFTYLMIVLGAWNLLSGSQNKSRYYQVQAFWLIIGVVPPLAASIVYSLHLVPINLTPFSFWLTGLTWAVAILYYGLLDMIPLARGLILDRMKTGVVVLDLNRRILDINPAAYRLLQVQGARLIGKTLEELKELQPDLSMIKFEMETLPQEISIKTPERRTFIEVSYSRFYGVKNEAAGWLLLFSDMTGHRRAEMLQRAAYQVSELAHTTSNLLEFYTAVHRIIGALIPARNFFIALYQPHNDSIVFPYAVDEVDTFPEEAALEGLTGYVIRNGRPLRYTPQREAEPVRDSGFSVIGSVCEDWLGVPLRTAEGRVIGALVAQTYTPGERYGDGDDEMLAFVSIQVAMVIERKSAEERLRVSEMRFRTLVENQGEGTNIMSPDGIFLFANPAAHDIFGVEPGGLIGREFRDFVDPVQYDFLRQQTERRKQGEKGTYEIDIQRPDGSIRSILITATPYISSQSEYMGSFGIFRDITELKQARNKLEYLSIHDALTGLYNRNYLEEHIQRIHESGLTPVSVLVADLDDLKVVNDSKGHAAGDELLRQTAEVFKGCFRPGDLIARFGGDEFVVLLPGLHANQCPVIIERVRSRIRQQNENSPELPIRISLGIATMNSGEQIESVMQRADEQMYLEKQSRKSTA